MCPVLPFAGGDDSGSGFPSYFRTPAQTARDALAGSITFCPLERGEVELVSPGLAPASPASSLAQASPNALAYTLSLLREQVGVDGGIVCVSVS